MASLIVVSATRGSHFSFSTNVVRGRLGLQTSQQVFQEWGECAV
jgi:hypothetical protein